MPRLPRLFVPRQTHQVVHRGNSRSAIFCDDADRQVYLGGLAEAVEAQGCALRAYVLMTNHVHLLVTAGPTTALPKVVQAAAPSGRDATADRHPRRHPAILGSRHRPVPEADRRSPAAAHEPAAARPTA